MTNKELIEKIDEALDFIEKDKKRNMYHGLCWIISNSQIIKVMRDFAQSRGLCAEGFWWKGGMGTESWYAPRIDFLQDWKNELMKEDAV